MRYNIELQPGSERMLIGIAESMGNVSVTNYTQRFDGTNDLGIIQFDEADRSDVEDYLDNCDEVITYR